MQVHFFIALRLALGIYLVMKLCNRYFDLEIITLYQKLSINSNDWNLHLSRIYIFFFLLLI